MTDLTITRSFPYPRELVWTAWTRAEHFAAWFGGDQLPVPLDRLDYVAEAGRAWSGVMLPPDGGSIEWAGEFVEVDPPTHLRLTITDRPSEAARSHLIIDFADEDGGAVVTMTQTDIPEGQEQPLREGYAHFFDALDAELARMR